MKIKWPQDSTVKSTSLLKLNNGILYLREVKKILALVCILYEENFQKQHRLTTMKSDICTNQKISSGALGAKVQNTWHKSCSIVLNCFISKSVSFWLGDDKTVSASKYEALSYPNRSHCGCCKFHVRTTSNYVTHTQNISLLNISEIIIGRYNLFDKPEATRYYKVSRIAYQRG